MQNSVGLPGTLLTHTVAGARMEGAIRAASVALLAALTAAAAQISIPLPFTPVPLTLQPMVVLLGGAVLGPRLGMSAQILYLLLGKVRAWDIWGAQLPLAIFAFVIALLIVWKHRTNISRLLAGTENTFKSKTE